MKNQSFKKINEIFLKNFLWLILGLLFISLIFSIFPQKEKKEEVPLNKLAEKILEDQVKEILVVGNDVLVTTVDGKKLSSKKEPEKTLQEQILNFVSEGDKEKLKEKLQKIDFKVREPGQISNFLSALFIYSLAPLLFLFLFFWWLGKQAKTGTGQIFDFTRAKPKILGPGGQLKEKVTFDDIGNLKEAKEELKEVVDFLKNPKKYLELGARIPRGILLVGAPGTGKTLLAKAIASMAGVPFFSISGSEFMELFVGVGASVTGDTPVLIKCQKFTKLLPIGEFVDQFFPPGKEGFMPVFGYQTLGYSPLETKVWGASGKSETKFFGKSCWTEIKGVYRHKVNEIYEIHYLGGVIKATGDHSIFIRHRNFIKPIKVTELKPGDVLVNLPFKVRSVFVPGIGTTHKIKAHEFSENLAEKELIVWNEELQLEKTQKAYEFALVNRGKIPQSKIAEKLRVCQMTISNWQRNIHQPQILRLAERYLEKGIPQKVKITPSLMKLLGYYTAEGRREDYYLQFVFGAHEKELHGDCINLMKEIFGVEPHLRYTKDNSLRITYHSKYLGDFFEKHCGNGASNKHIPEFLWDLPREYFLSYLDGLAKGDGWTSREKKLMIASTSKQLILELTWLSALHGIKVGVAKKKSRGGRIIKNKPLPESDYWVLTIGKSSNPFLEKEKSPYQFKHPIVKKIIKKPYNGYVYDLCGCENEAFFGGENPILLHNSRIRNLFDQAKRAKRAIIFIDEIDSIGKIRGIGVTGGHEEREQTLNQLLAEMDGIGREEEIIVLAATNKPEVLDPALLRPGRFDRRIVLDLPDLKGREEILQIHCRGKPLALDVNLKEIAERTPGFSGADLANLVNEASILAARKNKKQIFQEDFLEAIEKVLLGPERKSHLLTKKEKEIAAYHEVGHALVSAILKPDEPVRKVSIIARGFVAGYTLKTPTEEKKMKTKSEFLKEIAILLGGYVAEQIKFKEVTTGAANDLRTASYLARKMVKEYGMSSLGPIVFGERAELEFLGVEREIEKNYSEKLAEKIDKEVENFIKEGEKMARKILTERKKKLEKIAKILIEKETIEKEEFEKLIKEN